MLPKHSRTGESLLDLWQICQSRGLPLRSTSTFGAGHHDDVFGPILPRDSLHLANSVRNKRGTKTVICKEDFSV